MNGAKKRYDALVNRRFDVLTRARENAKLTIPSLMPDDGHTQSSRLIEPYQSIGSDGTVHVSNRLLMTLFPSGQPFFRLGLPPKLRFEIAKQTQGKEDLEIERGFALSEEMIMSEIEARNWRTATTMSLQQMVNSGNVLEYLAPDNNIKVFRLDQYVVVRDFYGNLLEVVIHEKLAPDALPEKARGLIGDVERDSTGNVKEIDLYTHLYREKDEYHVYQEVKDKEVPDSRGKFKIDEVPYAALRWSHIPGEDYGRSKVEEHIGDLRSLEALEKSSIELVAMMARNFIMIKPNANGGNLRRRLAKASNGDVVVGDWDAVKMMVFENASRNLQATEAKIAEKRQSLGRAFLMFSAARRDAERVTAEEIRLEADELDGALGGIYSTLSREMMAWRLKRLIIQMQDKQKLPAWDKQDVEPTILTGLEALSRQRDVQRVLAAGQLMAAFPNDAEDYVIAGDLLKKGFIGLGLPATIRTEAEAQQRRTERMQMEALTKGIGGAIPQIARQAAQPQQTEEK